MRLINITLALAVIFLVLGSFMTAVQFMGSTAENNPSDSNEPNELTIIWEAANGSDFTFTFDPNDSLVITIDLLVRTYETKEYLKEICWVRALTKLAQIYEDPNILDACMIAGFYSGNAHSWIEYSVRDGNEIEIIRYDPSYDVYLEPLPEDANLLIPVIPYKPKEALAIIYNNDLEAK